MHELSIAESILDAVSKELEQHGDARPTRIGLAIGELAAVDPESLKFCFEAVTRGTEWEAVELAIRICPARRQCIRCSYEFIVSDYNSTCPACSSNLTRPIGGDELEFDFLEIEKNGKLAAQV